MKKKLVTLMLTAGMIISLLSGCGQEESAKQGSKEEQTGSKMEESKVTVEKEESKKEDVVTVKWAMRTSPQDDDEQVFEAINDILREKYSLELEPIIISSGEYNDRMKLMITSGEDYDICFTASWANNFYDNVSREAFLPLDDLLASDAAELLRSALPAEYSEHCAVGTVAGNIYGIPNYQIQYTQIGAYIQKDLAEEYDLDVEAITSIRDLEPFMEWVRDNKEGIWPLAESNSFENTHYYVGADFEYAGLGEASISENFARFAAVDRNDEEFKVYSLFDNPYRVESWRLLNDYYKKGFVRSDVATVTDNTADRIANRYAIIIATAKPGGEAEFTAECGEEYIQIPFGEPFKEYTAGAETMSAINVNSKNPEAAIKMLGVMWSDKEIFNMILFGLEGEHYSKIHENKVEPIAESGYSRSDLAWSIGNQFLAYLLPGQADDAWEVTAAYNAKAPQSHLAGFVMDNSPVETERAQFSSVNGEYAKQYMYVEDFDAWLAEYREKIEVAGLKKCIEEVQKQIDAWRVDNGK